MKKIFAYIKNYYYFCGVFGISQTEETENPI